MKIHPHRTNVLNLLQKFLESTLSDKTEAIAACLKSLKKCLPPKPTTIQKDHDKEFVKYLIKLNKQPNESTLTQTETERFIRYLKATTYDENQHLLEFTKKTLFIHGHQTQ